MNVVQEIKRINEEEFKRSIIGGITPGSWHEQYQSSKWVFVGNLATALTEGDVLCFMSEWGEIADINLIRDKDSGKSKGFCFLKYEDQRSTILAVDNFNGITVLDRTIRVDHMNQYKLPKNILDKELALLEEDPDHKTDVAKLSGPGHAYEGVKLANEYTLHNSQSVFGNAVNASVSKSNKRGREDMYEDASLDLPEAPAKPSKAERKAEKKEAKKMKKVEKKEMKKEAKKKKKEEKKASKKAKKEAKREKKEKGDKRNEEKEKDFKASSSNDDSDSSNDSDDEKEKSNKRRYYSDSD
jgi:RNA-binding motif protein, X-linked 2